MSMEDKIDLIPTCTGFIVDGFLKYAPAFFTGENDNIPKPIIQGWDYIYFDTEEEALDYANNVDKSKLQKQLKQQY